MPDAPLVTIITPAFNAERYIDACVGSVVMQTLASVEQIVADDGSTDGTPMRLRAWHDRRLRHIPLPHSQTAAFDLPQESRHEAAAAI